MSLSPRQRVFVAEYLLDFNATQAAIRAGYSERTAKQQGQRLLTNADLKAEVEQAIDERNARTRVSQDRVLKELARVAFSDMKSFAEWGPTGVRLRNSDDLSADDSAAVTEVSESHGENGRTLKFKLGHKDSALKLLAQHVGLLDGGSEIGRLADTFLAGAEARRQMEVPDLSEG